jgi:phosphoribosylanthranilate isomerase
MGVDEVLIKICGLTNRGDAEAAIAAGADLVGFVFVPATPRAVTPEQAGWIRDLAGAETVGVFQDASLDSVLAVRDELALDRVQLHGDEPESYLETLGATTLRRIRPGPGLDWHQIARLGERCLPLLDPGGGDGIAWGWQKLGEPPLGLRYGLAGGLRPDNVAEAVTALRPWLVDVSSGVERGRGVKDIELVCEFIDNARGAVAMLTNPGWGPDSEP